MRKEDIMVEFIMQYWLTVLFGFISAALAAGFRNLYKKSKALELGVQAILRDRIVQSYYHYKERGTISLHGLENVELMYDQYHNLGGNGTVTKLVIDMRELPVVDD